MSKATSNYFSLFLTRFLSLGATLSVGLLSYTGAIAVGFSVPFAVFAFIITAAIEAQVFHTNIIESFSSIVNKLPKIKNKPAKIAKFTALFIFSVLAALGLGITTFSSALAMLPFSISAVLGIISALSFTLIIYKSISDTVNKLLPKLLSHLQKHKLSWSNVASLAVLSLGLFVTVTTASTWWEDITTSLPLLMPATFARIMSFIIAPMCIAGFNIFLLGNAIEATEKFSTFKPGKAAANFTKEFKDNPGLIFNPAYYIVKVISTITAFALSLAHSACQALIAGRTSLATLAGTILDFLCDANYGLADDGHHDHATKDGHKDKSHNKSQCSHNHEIFDNIVKAAQIIFTLPVQLFAIPLHYFISTAVGKYKTWAQCFKESFNFIYQSPQDNLVKTGTSAPAAILPKAAVPGGSISGPFDIPLPLSPASLASNSEHITTPAFQLPECRM